MGPEPLDRALREVAGYLHPSAGHPFDWARLRHEDFGPFIATLALFLTWPALATIALSHRALREAAVRIFGYILVFPPVTVPVLMMGLVWLAARGNLPIMVWGTVAVGLVLGKLGAVAAGWHGGRTLVEQPLSTPILALLAMGGITVLWHMELAPLAHTLFAGGLAWLAVGAVRRFGDERLLSDIGGLGNPAMIGAVFVLTLLTGMATTVLPDLARMGSLPFAAMDGWWEPAAPTFGQRFDQGWALMAQYGAAPPRAGIGRFMAALADHALLGGLILGAATGLGRKMTG